jgi:hypothetical protein
MFFTTMLALPFIILFAQLGCAMVNAVIEKLDGRYPPATGIPVKAYPRLNIVQGHPVGLDTCMYCRKVCQFNPNSTYYDCWNCGCYNPVSGVAEWPMSTRERNADEERRVRRLKRNFKVAGIVVALFVLAFIGLFIYAATLPNTWSA